MNNLLSGINKKLITYILIALGVVIGIFILMAILKGLKGKSYSYSEMENELKRGATSYYEKNESLLPTLEGGIVTVDDVTLSDAGVMKKLSSMKKGATCTGTVTVQKNGEYYLYTPSLDCGENFKTSNLTEKIKVDNPSTNSGDGLYPIGGNLVFRGEKVNNYISFAGKTWRIIRINEDNTLRVIQNDIIYTGVWDDRYNINRESNDGINDFNVSRLQDGLDKIYYELDMFDENAKQKIVMKPLCIGKRYEEETDKSGNVECLVKTEAKPIGLLNTNEFMLASIDTNCVHTYDEQCSNYNYMATLQKSTWTLNADASNTHKAYRFNGVVYSPSMCSNETGLRLVINLSGNIPYTSGDGTEENPYIVK